MSKTTKKIASTRSRKIDNPWSPEHWNLTAQGQYLRTYGFAKAQKMAARAGRGVTVDDKSALNYHPVHIRPQTVTTLSKERLDEQATFAADRDDAALTNKESAAEIENRRLVKQTGAKPSNPKDALGVLKIPRSTVSAPVMAEVGIGMLEGAMKYGRHNYRAIGVRGSVYYDATCRHLDAWWEGEDYDPDSFVGLHHISKAIASLCVLRDAMIQNKFVDDRPPKSQDGWMGPLNEKVKALIAKYPSPVSPYVEGDERMKKGS